MEFSRKGDKRDVSCDFSQGHTHTHTGTCWNGTLLLRGGVRGVLVVSVGAEDGLDVLPGVWFVDADPCGRGMCKAGTWRPPPQAPHLPGAPPTFLEGVPSTEELPVGPVLRAGSQPVDGGHIGTPGRLLRLEAAGEVKRLRAGWGDAKSHPQSRPGSHLKVWGFSSAATSSTRSSVEPLGTVTEVE